MDEEELDVMVLGDGVHTLESPYCDDPGCWCHTDVEYHDWVQHPAYSVEEIEEAYGFYGVRY